eukprot:scaffold17139_cov123-Isochrysis_galbana.AAC.13
MAADSGACAFENRHTSCGCAVPSSCWATKSASSDVAAKMQLLRESADTKREVRIAVPNKRLLQHLPRLIAHQRRTPLPERASMVADEGGFGELRDVPASAFLVPRCEPLYYYLLEM